MRTVKIGILVLFFAGFSCTSKKNEEYKKIFDDPLLYCTTVKKLNDVVLENNFPPMIASRNYVYANIAAYETMVAGNKDFVSLSGLIKHLPIMPKPEAGKDINFSLATLFSFIKVGNAVTFPEGSMMEYYEELKKKALDGGMPSEMLKNTIAFSDTIVSKVMGWSKGDNYARTRSAVKYTVTDEEGRWTPTPPMYGSAVEPHWGEIRTLVLDSASQFVPADPPVFDIKNKNSKFYKYLMEVKNTGDSLTNEQKWIADFWDDNPFKLNVSGHVMFATKKFSPAGHWQNIVGIAVKKSNVDFANAVHAYTKTSVALFDAFISCWHAKFKTNYVRPETVINSTLTKAGNHISRRLRFLLIPADIPPYLPRPPETMTALFGDNMAYTDTSEMEFGIEARSFTSFRQAALEASMSRVYGGIHYWFDCDTGNKMGTKLGDLICQRLKLKKK